MFLKWQCQDLKAAHPAPRPPPVPLAVAVSQQLTHGPLSFQSLLWLLCVPSSKGSGGSALSQREAPGSAVPGLGSDSGPGNSNSTSKLGTPCRLAKDAEKAESGDAKTRPCRLQRARSLPTRPSTDARPRTAPPTAWPFYPRSSKNFHGLFS